VRVAGLAKPLRFTVTTLATTCPLFGWGSSVASPESGDCKRLHERFVVGNRHQHHSSAGRLATAVPTAEGRSVEQHGVLRNETVDNSNLNDLVPVEECFRVSRKLGCGSQAVTYWVVRRNSD
jgi:hypothetical protein